MAKHRNYSRGKGEIQYIPKEKSRVLVLSKDELQELVNQGIVEIVDPKGETQKELEE